MNPRVDFVLPNSGYTLTLKFTNGEMRLFDVKPYLDKGIFQELEESREFNSVKPFLGSVRWQGGQDFCPDTLYEDSIPLESRDLKTVMDEIGNNAQERGLTPEILQELLNEKDTRSLGEIMDEASDEAEQKGLTPELLKSILEDDQAT